MNRSKFLPPAGPAVLDRERLMNKLASWESRKLVLVHGPAGQGKSTLAAEYVRNLGISPVWYTLDRSDDDPAVLLSGLAAAVQQAHPRLTGAFAAMPRLRYGAASPSRSFAQWQESILAALPDGLIVFDDYPADEGSPAVRQVIAALIEGTRPAVRIMILSRARPALDVGRLRAKRLVGEIGGEELRFSSVETASLFGSVFGMPVPSRDAVELNRVTEGWAAGLVLLHEYLAALPPDLRSQAVRGRGTADVPGQVFDYLAQEVFSRLPSRIQDFLLRTSVADHLPLPLLAVLTGLPESGGDGALTASGMVSELQRRNLFVSAVDAGGTTIRYHALFRDFLRKRAASLLRPADRKRLHLAAATYFARRGDTVRSIELLLGSGQADRALALLERAGSGLIASGRLPTLLRLIDGLPAPLQDRPWPLFFRAVACRFSEARRALTLFERAHAGFTAAGSADGQALSLSGIVEASVHSGGDFRRMERAAGKARTVLRSRKTLSRISKARLLLALGTAFFFTGRLGPATAALRDAMTLFRTLGDRFHEVSSAVYLAPCALYAGDFPVARDAIRRGFEAQRSIGDEPGGEAALHLVQAMTELFDGNFPEARASVDACRKLAQDNGLESLDLLLLVIAGWVGLAEGDYEGAEALLRECHGRGEAAQGAFFSLTASHILAIVLLFQGRLDEAKKASDHALSAKPSGGSRLFRGIYLIISGAVHLELGRLTRAGTDLRTARALLRACGAAQQEANAHLMLARLAVRKGETDALGRHLREGFSIGREREFTYYAPLTSVQLRELARAAVQRGICVDYCTSLLDRRQPSPAIRVFCLGGFRVERDGIPVRDAAWKSKQAKSLLKLLVTRGRHRLSRDAALEALWPGADADVRPSLLTGLLHRARRAIDPPGTPARTGSSIVMENDQLSLNEALVWTDVEAFLAAVEQARRARTKGDQAGELASYERAVELYAGDLLPGDPYEEWTAAPREQMRSLFTEAIDHAAEAREALGDRSRSLAFYERMFTFDPCHDKACRWLMQRYSAEGERNKAVRVYERHELAVRRELDMEPDEMTKRVYRSIIGG